MQEKKFNLKELEELERLNGRLDHVRFCISDMNGIDRSQLIPRRHLEQNLLGGFAAFSGSTCVDSRANFAFVKEVNDVNFGNIQIVPFPGTLRILPWAGKRKHKEEGPQRKIGQVICESKWLSPYKGGAFQNGCSRFALRKQLEKLKEMGFILKSAFELEFTLLEQDSGKPVFSGLDALSTLIHSRFEDFLCRIEEMCFQAGVDVNGTKIEHGKGAFELSLEPQEGVEMSDQVFVAKQAIKEISHQYGYIATFMSKCDQNISTNGFHLNLSLWKENDKGQMINVFYDSNDPNKISATLRHFLAGVLKHGKSLTAFCSPTINCYRRLHCFYATDKINWNFDDRTVAFRVKNLSPSATYIENRMPSSASNPYLATAATLIAGMDGIINKYELEPPSSELPNREYIKKMPVINKDTEKEKYMPYTLKEALEELEKDKVLTEGMGEELVTWFLEIKKQLELKFVKGPSEEEKWKQERELYLELI